MIRSFRDAETELLFRGREVRRMPPEIRRPAQRALRAVHQARNLNDLALLPGNRLERLRGDREGQHSVRINQQWRVCFRWEGGDAFEVEVVDYH
ncbi:MAG: type II toxin-antitoxin system RelE/ParE family toxin [Dehalococcoidia bacterium]